jgi:hypothetical protein
MSGTDTSTRPPWVARFNALGNNVGGAEHLLSLDHSSLLAAAMSTTGLDDFGADTWREPFGILLAAIESEAQLNTLGRIVTGAEIVRYLQNRLRIVEFWKRHPEVLEEEVENPIFITGTARSGTSILLELLAQDPDNRCPATWEILFSVPPPEPGSYATDSRISAADHEVTLWHEICPEYLAMHANGGELPNECIFLMAHEFASNHFSGVLNVPSYASWLHTADLTPAYGFHRDQLKLLQSRYRKDRWIFKAPSHLGTLSTLFAVYPHAKVIVTHRDPTKTIASTISLMATLRKMRSDQVDLKSLAATLAIGLPMTLDKMTKERHDGITPDECFVDLRFHDLMSDPIETIRRTYAQLEIALSAEAEDLMRAYLAAKPRAKHGRHHYSLQDFDIDARRVRDATTHYVDTFDIPREG